MSVDLNWHLLSAELSSTLVTLLNNTLTTTTRPSFIGPVEVTGIEFGERPPEVELVDMRDIYRDFLEEEDEVQAEETQGGLIPERKEDDVDGFEWVSRRAARREEGLASLQRPMFASTPTLPTLNGLHPYPDANLMDYRPSYSYASPGDDTPFRRPLSMLAVPLNTAIPPPSPSGSTQSLDDGRKSSSEDSLPPPAPQSNPHPNLQLHLRISWNSDLRITLTTSLLINYPSPGFMSLPIKLSVTGLVFEGEVVVAYEGDPSEYRDRTEKRRRKRMEGEEKTGNERKVHLCILDELDPYGPKVDRDRTRDDLDSDPKSKTLLPISHRLLPTIYIESEIGQADKHVLKNVNRVERFIQDVIRKTVEEELVFPNFCTIVLESGEGE